MHPSFPSSSSSLSLSTASGRSRAMSDPTSIQNHLYQAFLQGRTADVSLRVRGSWDGIYKLHRVVLIQAGFFQSLFDSGFREARHGEQNMVQFDDPNITRPAFDFCLARLYGGGPSLYLDPRLIPTRREPLTPNFPNVLPPTPVPASSHLAAPRFLLSLLATAIYLSIPSLVSQAILMALQSLGPHTVVRYLNFAIGKGIGPADTDEETLVVKGLENLCLQPSTSTRSTSIRSRASKASRRNTASEIFSSEPIPIPPVPTAAHKEENDPTAVEPSSGSDIDSDEVEDDVEDDGPVFMYGNASNKIGEAAACWLCRWGSDMLAYEESAEATSPSSVDSQNVSVSSSESREALKVPFPDPSGPSLPSSSASESTASKNMNANANVPVVWRRGGINARWVRAVVSSDSLFVKAERDRYDIAKRVVELRRRVSIDKREEIEWTELFSTGIYYMHMSLDDLMAISQDVSPTTGRPYVPASVLQAAHWNQSLLRHHINHRPSNSIGPLTPPRSPAPGSTPSPNNDGLGIAQTTAELISRLADNQSGSLDSHKLYYPIPVDSSSRIGDTTGIENATMDQLFTHASAKEVSPSSGSKPNMTSHPLSTFFGIQTSPKTATGCIEADTVGRSTWSAFPPVRFGVEFWGVERLAEKERLTSQTIWYAGSLFNVYVQVMRKKGMQLGMYVHRLSPVEAIPTPSAPPLPPPSASMSSEPRAGVAFERSETIDVPPSMSTPTLYRPTSRNTVSIPPRASTPASSPGTGLALSYSPPTTARSFGGGPATSQTHTHSPSTSSVTQTPSSSGSGGHTRPPAQPYRDPREAVRAHFTLHVGSPMGGALTRFASEPDRFFVGRSWGWKSSALQTEELVEVDLLGSPGAGSGAGAGGRRKECSLRAMVVLGVV